MPIQFAITGEWKDKDRLNQIAKDVDLIDLIKFSQNLIQENMLSNAVNHNLRVSFGPSATQSLFLCRPVTTIFRGNQTKLLMLSHIPYSQIPLRWIALSSCRLVRILYPLKPLL